MKKKYIYARNTKCTVCIFLVRTSFPLHRSICHMYFRKKNPEKVPVEIKKNNKTPFHCHTVYWYMLYFFFKLSYTVRMHMPLECHYLRTKQHGWYYSLILNQSHEFVKSATYILPARLSSFSYFCPK